MLQKKLLKSPKTSNLNFSQRSTAFFLKRAVGEAGLTKASLGFAEQKGSIGYADKVILPQDRHKRPVGTIPTGRYFCASRKVPVVFLNSLAVQVQLIEPRDR